MQKNRDSARSSSISFRAKLALIGFVAVAGFFLLTEHRAHLFGILPYVLLLLCPLLHLFMHGRHGGHGRHGVGHSGATEKTEKHEH
jgi:hypothetical protein